MLTFNSLFPCIELFKVLPRTFKDVMLHCSVSHKVEWYSIILYKQLHVLYREGFPVTLVLKLNTSNLVIGSKIVN